MFGLQWELAVETSLQCSSVLPLARLHVQAVVLPSVLAWLCYGVRPRSLSAWPASHRAGLTHPPVAGSTRVASQMAFWCVIFDSCGGTGKRVVLWVVCCVLCLCEVCVLRFYYTCRAANILTSTEATSAVANMHTNMRENTVFFWISRHPPKQNGRIAGVSKMCCVV
jgi:hypothetical protein